MRLSGQDQIPDCKGCKRLDDNRSAHCHAGIVASSDSDIGNLSIAVGHRELTRDSRGGLEKNVEKERHSDPRIPAASIPRPYSNALTAFRLIMASASRACVFPNTGDPMAAGTPLMMHDTRPPVESVLRRASSTLASIRRSVASS